MDQYIIEDDVLVEYIPEDYEADELNAIVPEGVKVIGQNAFQYFGRLKSVKLPDSVEKIEDGAFFECVNLTQINIHENIIEIEDEAFSRCYGLANEDGFIIINNILFGFVGNKEEIIIPSHITRISARAFLSNPFVKKVILNEGLVSIGEEAFCNCINLKEVNKPKSLVEIGEYAFD